MSPSPHGLVGIRLAEKQIETLRQRIDTLQQDPGYAQDVECYEKLQGLMQKFGITSQDVVELLMLRGNLELAPNLTVSRFLRHIFSLIEGEARVERRA
ncbi:hypothetical protein [Pseudomonas sp. GM25]|uniref:hypothetical protein n=1 Tax=Pseudomonas sp. GM25 TaxID=1144327 RepID=UPI00026FF394|nr:hypothetical protein [Pseudomonas sp. GM25]EJM31290.1 hypothetical protein PMI24_00836 [Pseudomonas sp. GM25]